MKKTHNRKHSHSPIKQILLFNQKTGVSNLQITFSLLYNIIYIFQSIQLFCNAAISAVEKIDPALLTCVVNMDTFDKMNIRG